MLEKSRIAAEVTGLNLKVLVRKWAFFPWSSSYLKKGGGNWRWGAGGHWKSLGDAEVELESQRSLSASWEGSRLQKSSPQNTKSTFAQTKLSLVAAIRTALSSLVSIATLWLLLWKKELDKMTEGEKGKRERSDLVSTPARPEFVISFSLTCLSVC